MTTKCKQLVYELRLATSGHESHNSHISSGTGEYFFLMAFHTLSLLLFPLLHFPTLRYAPAFSTFAFSTRAFSAPPAQAAPYHVVPVCFQYRTSPGDQSGVTIQILFGLIGRVGKDRQDVFVSHGPPKTVQNDVKSHNLICTLSEALDIMAQNGSALTVVLALCSLGGACQQ